jgi:hypothetical protein
VGDQPEIATRGEALELLTKKAREGSTRAAIALEEALRDAPPGDELDDELERILRGD